MDREVHGVEESDTTEHTPHTHTHTHTQVLVATCGDLVP